CMVIFSIELILCYFFFSSRRRHTRSKRDWSSDVCSSDLPTNSSDVEAVNAESVSDLEDGSDGGDRAEIVDVDGEGESEEAEDDPAPTEDDEVADETPEDINNNDPPVEEKVEEEEVEEEVKSSQAVTPMADLGNIFEFEYFRKDGADVEDGHEVDFDAEYQLQYKWDTKDAEVKAGDTATLT